MNTIQRSLVFISASIFTLLFTANTNAATVIPSNYMVAGDIGDTWTYSTIDGTQLTWTLSEITSGTNAGRRQIGDDVSSMIYDLTGNVLSIYQVYGIPPFDAPIVYSETELGQVVTLNDDPINPSMYLFLDMPSITVQAGTFNDVLAVVWFDGNYSANVANNQLGLDPQITAGVTDIDYYARGIGMVKYTDIDAGTGLIGNEYYELASTTVVPIPAALPLFLSGLFGLFFLSKNKTKKTA